MRIARGQDRCLANSRDLHRPVPIRPIQFLVVTLLHNPVNNPARLNGNFDAMNMVTGLVILVQGLDKLADDDVPIQLIIVRHIDGHT
jgi:hypothetical protein